MTFPYDLIFRMFHLDLDQGFAVLKAWTRTLWFRLSGPVRPFARATVSRRGMMIDCVFFFGCCGFRFECKIGLEQRVWNLFGNCTMEF